MPFRRAISSKNGAVAPPAAPKQRSKCQECSLRFKRKGSIFNDDNEEERKGYFCHGCYEESGGTDKDLDTYCLECIEDTDNGYFCGTCRKYYCNDCKPRWRHKEGGVEHKYCSSWCGTEAMQRAEEEKEKEKARAQEEAKREKKKKNGNNYYRCEDCRRGLDNVTCCTSETNGAKTGFYCRSCYEDIGDKEPFCHGCVREAGYFCEGTCSRFFCDDCWDAVGPRNGCCSKNCYKGKKAEQQQKKEAAKAKQKQLKRMDTRNKDNIDVKEYKFQCKGRGCRRGINHYTSRFYNGDELEDVGFYCKGCFHQTGVKDMFCSECIQHIGGDFCAGTCSRFQCEDCLPRDQWVPGEGEDNYCCHECTKPPSQPLGMKRHGSRVHYTTQWDQEEEVDPNDKYASQTRQCNGLTRMGFRCKVTAASDVEAAISLRKGDMFCLRHGGRSHAGDDLYCEIDDDNAVVRGSGSDCEQSNFSDEDEGVPGGRRLYTIASF